MNRSASVHVAGRLSYRPLLEAFWARNPTGTLKEARRATGAPQNTVRHVYAQLVERRAIRPQHWKFNRSPTEAPNGAP